MSTRRLPFSLISMVPFLRGFIKSYAGTSEPLVCEDCGLSLRARVEDGTSLCVSIDLFCPPNVLRFRHAVVLTSDGKLSISCGSSTSDGTAISSHAK